MKPVRRPTNRIEEDDDPGMMYEGRRTGWA